MTDPKDTQTPLYYLTATDAKGRSLTSWNQDARRWKHGPLGEDSFLDRVSLICALDAAEEEGHTDVKVHRVLIGDELISEEINILRKEEERARRKIARELLIVEKDLSPEEVAILSEV